MSGIIGGARSKSGVIGPKTRVDTPAFLVQIGVTQANIAHGSWIPYVFGTEHFDQCNDFTTGDPSRFTAPVIGRYFFHLETGINSLDVGATYYHTGIVTTKRSYFTTNSGINFGTSNPSYSRVTFSITCDMDAGDTCHAQIYQATGGSGGTVDIDGGSRFSGFLVA